MSKEKWEFRFCECEHDGDLEHYASELESFGAEVIDQRIDSYEYEEGVVTVFISAGKAFKKEFDRKIYESDIGGFIESRSFICNVD